MPVIVEERYSYSWPCGAVGHMAKACPSKKSASRLSKTAAVVTEAAVQSGEVTDGESNDVNKKGQKTPSSPPQ